MNTIYVVQIFISEVEEWHDTEAGAARYPLGKLALSHLKDALPHREFRLIKRITMDEVVS